MDAEVTDARDGVEGGVGRPGLAVGVAEAHGEVHDEPFARALGEVTQVAQQGPGRLQGAPGVAALEGVGDAEGIADAGDARLRGGAFQAARVGDDAEVVAFPGVGEFGEDGLGVGELGDGARTDEGAEVEVGEARVEQGAQVRGLVRGGDVVREALPGVAGAFDVHDRLAGVAGRWRGHVPSIERGPVTAPVTNLPHFDRFNLCFPYSYFRRDRVQWERPASVPPPSPPFSGASGSRCLKVVQRFYKDALPCLTSTSTTRLASSRRARSSSGPASRPRPCASGNVVTACPRRSATRAGIGSTAPPT